MSDLYISDPSHIVSDNCNVQLRKQWKGDCFQMHRSDATAAAAAAAPAGRLQHLLAGWTLTKSKWNVHVYLDIYDLSPTHTNKQ